MSARGEQQPRGDPVPGSDAGTPVSSGLISGRYRLGELLGTGGSASVFAATDTVTGAQVALKLLHPHLSGRSSVREAFFAEARRAQPLRHANIVGVLGVGVHEASGDAVAWMALERAEGSSLSEHVARHGALSVVDALAVTGGVLRALEVAHGTGLIHRDVSPANVMVVGPPGEIDVAGVRLLDFGLADAAGRAALGSDILRSEDAGEHAGVIGSVDYMSPEQIRGNPVDERGDIYQTGGLLYFAVTGRPPFARPTPAETMHAHLEVPPPVPSVMDSRIPRSLDRVVVRAMLKDPDDRFATAAEMRAAIEAGGLGGGPAAADAEAGLQRSGMAAAESTRVLGMTNVPGRLPPSAARTQVQPVARTSQKRSGISELAGDGAGTSRRSRTLATGRGNRVVAWVSGIVAVTAVSGIVAFASSNSPATPVPLPTSSAPSPAPAPSPELIEPSPSAGAWTAPLPPSALVPELAMMRLADARVALSNAGLIPGALAVVDSGHVGDTVLGSSPEGGARVEGGSIVDLTVASGFNVVPDVVGKSRASALALVQSAGFTVIFSTTRSNLAAKGTVASVEPLPGTVLRLGTTVTLFEADGTSPVATATPTPLPSSTPLPSENSRQR